MVMGHLWSPKYVCPFPVYPQQIQNTPGSLRFLDSSFFSEDFKIPLRMVWASGAIFTST